MAADEDRGGWRRHAPLLEVCAVIFAMLGLLGWRFAAPPARPGDAPAQQFSAVRAHEPLKQIVADGQPRTPGSSGSRKARAAIVEQLKALDLDPQVETRIGCRAGWLCATLHNIVVRIPGRRSVETDAPVLLLAAHYDSVGAGPGANDDAVGVAAVLEVARALKASPPLQHDVVLLIDDGEELGLLGATAFMNNNPLAKRVVAAINLEGRGSAGPSLMFESAGPSRVMSGMLSQLRRPLSSSLFNAVYELLPNDTDFSVFRRRGVLGFNFAYVDAVEHYHTSLDDLAHVQLNSLQHHGENALALVRALDEHDLRALKHTPDDASVWFDWLGFFIVSWSGKWTVWLALLALALLLAQTFVVARTSETFFRSSLKIFAAFLALLVGSVLLGVATVELTRLRGHALMPWTAYPQVWLVALVAAVLAVGLALVRSCRNVPPRIAYVALWLCWSLLGVALALFFPAASHLLIVPSLCAALVGGLLLLPAFAGERPARWLRLVPLVIVLGMWGRVIFGLLQAVGIMGHPGITVALALIGSAALPALFPWAGRAGQVGRFGPRVCFAIYAVATVAALATPAFRSDAPQRLSLAHYQSAEGEASWFADASFGAIPAALQQAGGFAAPGPPALPLFGFRAVAHGNAPAISVEGPLLRGGQEQGHRDARTLRLMVASRRGAQVYLILAPPEAKLQGLSINGRKQIFRRLPASPQWPDYQLSAFLADSDAPFLLELDVARGSAGWVDVVDVVRALPASAKPLLEARGSAGVPSQEGDLSLVATRFAWP